jgi:hypothetical protein
VLDVRPAGFADGSELKTVVRLDERAFSGAEPFARALAAPSVIAAGTVTRFQRLNARSKRDVRKAFRLRRPPRTRASMSVARITVRTSPEAC